MNRVSGSAAVCALRRAGLVALAVVLSAGLVRALAQNQSQTPSQTQPQPQTEKDKSYAARKKQAIELFNSQKLVQAMPVFEDLHAEKPDDAVVLGLLSFTVLANAATLKNPEARKQERVRARKLALEAQAAGDNSNLTKVVLEVPEDGSEAVFSGHAAVQTVMEEGEAAFAKGDFDAALAAYDKVLALDPHQYEAALFSGDLYFKRGDHERAARWLGRAVEIDPNQETAYRYWGDDLVAQGRLDEAKAKFIEAIVAEPYKRRSWVGLSQWAPKQKLTLAQPQIEPPGKIENKGDQTNITIDASMLDKKASKDGTSAWFMYTLFRASWHGERFQKEFPEEKAYRHSLREEIDGFQAVVNQVKEDMKKNKIKKLDPALATLVKLSDERLLESYVLISRADEGIAKDYPAYRDAHREKIRQYIDEWIIQRSK